jgi:translation initiation factor 1
MSNANSRPVYSSAQGRLCPDCGQPVTSCQCKKVTTLPGDGKVRVRCERKGHGGKTVTVITGLPLAEAVLLTLAGELKRRCGCGGTIKAGNIEIQGDHADLLLNELLKRGYTAKRAGG